MVKEDIGISFHELKLLLEDINAKKDEFLFVIIKKHWPRNILPNHLTVARIIIGILLFFLLFNFRNNNGLIILPLFFVALASDLLDGAVARCFNLQSKLGEILDPIADKILIIPVAIYLLLANNKIFLFLILVIEIVNALISITAHDEKIFHGSNIFGKTKMVLESLVLLILMAFWPGFNNDIFQLIINTILALAVIFAVISLYTKIIEVKLHYAKKHQTL